MCAARAGGALVVVENDKVSLIKVYWNGFLIIKAGGWRFGGSAGVTAYVTPNYRLHLSHCDDVIDYYFKVVYEHYREIPQIQLA